MSKLYRSRSKGFSLIELLVSMAIGLILMLAITSVLLRSEGDRRTSITVNDINQTGAYVAYVMDRSIRNAGSGFAQSWQDSFGCLINAANAGTQTLPRPATFPAPFASVPQNLGLVPVLIGKGMADTPTEVRGDILTVMAGTTAYGETAFKVIPGSLTNNDLRLSNIIGYRPGDLVLISDDTVLAGCMLQQISSITAPDMLSFGGDFYKATGSTVSITNFGSSTALLRLGNMPDNPAQLQLFGVGDNNALFSQDLLQNSQPEPIADGVVEMRALYGVDSTTPPDGTIDQWIDPTAGSGYTRVDLNDGSATARLRLRGVVAIRLGFIFRTTLQERDAVAQPATLTLFNDLGGTLPQTRNLSGTDLNHRWRTLELTIPLRNMPIAPTS